MTTLLCTKQKEGGKGRQSRRSGRGEAEGARSYQGAAGTVRAGSGEGRNTNYNTVHMTQVVKQSLTRNIHCTYEYTVVACSESRRIL